MLRYLFFLKGANANVIKMIIGVMLVYLIPELMFTFHIFGFPIIVVGIMSFLFMGSGFNYLDVQSGMIERPEDWHMPKTNEQSDNVHPILWLLFVLTIVLGFIRMMYILP